MFIAIVHSYHRLEIRLSYKDLYFDKCKIKLLFLSMLNSIPFKKIWSCLILALIIGYDYLK